MPRAIISPGSRDDDAAQWWAAASVTADPPPILAPLLRRYARSLHILASHDEAIAIFEWASRLPAWESGEHGADRPLLVAWERIAGGFGFE